MYNVRTHVTAADVTNRWQDPIPVIDAEQALEVELKLGDHGAEDLISIELQVPQARKWWPRGHGPQQLYNLHVQVLSPGKLGNAELSHGF